MKTTLSPIQQERLDDLKTLANHGGRDQWHGLRCHHINNGQFTATYSDLAHRWGVTSSVVYSTIKKFIKLGFISTERFLRATLFTILEAEPTEDPKDPKGPKDLSFTIANTEAEITKKAKRAKSRLVKKKRNKYWVNTYQGKRIIKISPPYLRTSRF